MKCAAMVIMTMMLSSCSSLESYIPGPEQRAARNLCESMRSYRPYYPNECGEQTGEMPQPFGAR
jgi:hypothetical protein